MDVIVSVIVPIYKVEPYITKCISSIINQTYDNLEIILVDDGSPDCCNLICDEFAACDKRIRVIHQRNLGLSEARNHGIDISTGSYILFVDGDDYIEPNTVERLLQTCIENCADVSCCGHYWEHENNVATHSLTNARKCYEGEEILEASLKGWVFKECAWNKLWKRQLFDNECKFPPGRYFEDIATTWRLFRKCKRVTCVPDILYHYVARKSSIGNTKNIKNLVDRWLAFRERFEVMGRESEIFRQICTVGCLQTIGYTWRWLYKVDIKEREKHEVEIQEMRSFLKANRDDIKRCSFSTRVSLFCALHSNSITIFVCYYLNQLYRKIHGLDRMK